MTYLIKVLTLKCYLNTVLSSCKNESSRFLLIQKQIHRIGMNILPNSKRLLGTHFCSVSLTYSFAKTKVGFLMEGSVDFFSAH